MVLCAWSEPPAESAALLLILNSATQTLSVTLTRSARTRAAVLPCSCRFMRLGSVASTVAGDAALPLEPKLPVSVDALPADMAFTGFKSVRTSHQDGRQGSMTSQ